MGSWIRRNISCTVDGDPKVEIHGLVQTSELAVTPPVDLALEVIHPARRDRVTANPLLRLCAIVVVDQHLVAPLDFATARNVADQLNRPVDEENGGLFGNIDLEVHPTRRASGRDPGWLVQAIPDLGSDDSLHFFAWSTEDELLESPHRSLGRSTEHSIGRTGVEPDVLQTSLQPFHLRADHVVDEVALERNDGSGRRWRNS